MKKVKKVPTGVSLRPEDVRALSVLSHKYYMTRSAMVAKLIALMVDLERDGGFLLRSDEIHRYVLSVHGPRHLTTLEELEHV